MAADPEPLFTDPELRSYLPTGWRLTDQEGAWDARGKRWRITVEDGARMSWPLEVTAKAATAHGRLEALRRAFDGLVRHRLG